MEIPVFYGHSHSESTKEKNINIFQILHADLKQSLVNSSEMICSIIILFGGPLDE